MCINNGAGTSVPSNEKEQGAGTLVPLSDSRKNGTEVPAPGGVKVNGTAPKGIHFDKVPAPNYLSVDGNFCMGILAEYNISVKESEI